MSAVIVVIGLIQCHQLWISKSACRAGRWWSESH